MEAKIKEEKIINPIYKEFNEKIIIMLEDLINFRDDYKFGECVNCKVVNWQTEYNCLIDEIKIIIDIEKIIFRKQVEIYNQKT